METLIKYIALGIAGLPLFGAILAGLLGKTLGRVTSHRLTISFMFVAFVLSLYLSKLVFWDAGSFNGAIYHWAVSGRFVMDVGFQIDPLSTVMIVVVSFVSWLVHIYSIGYMAEDDGYQRFFSYISLFTFAMYMLVMANNFMQLFFGWEGVGVVSYLLIGFWFERESALAGSLKAFLANRVGDFGFILAIGAILTYFNTLDYQTVFAAASQVAQNHLMVAFFPQHQAPVITVICLLLFVGAMGKSAQVPLHVWLPESMEGPTPISALIHAATMVTAGVFMVARTSPLFELSQTALSVVLVIGATGALFMGLVGLVQNDIKRVVAYSTLSQLGYMVAALGASAYAAGLFHLLTHACFKALLFLAAGSVIIGMHHEQDMRKMGGLKKYMPITYWTFLIGSLALCAIPPFSGFYSKDAIIEAVHLSTIPGAHYAYFCVLVGALVTSLYTFRAFFLTFHGPSRADAKTLSHCHESPWVVCLPLVLLAIPSLLQGAMMVKSILYQTPSLLGNTIYVNASHNVLAEMAPEFPGWFAAIFHALTSPTFWLALSGIVIAWYFCLFAPNQRDNLVRVFGLPYMILLKKYGFDDFNELVLADGTKRLSDFLYRVADRFIIDGICVNGFGRFIVACSRLIRRLQTGYLYHYAFAMLLGLLALIVWQRYVAGDQALLLSLLSIPHA